MLFSGSRSKLKGETLDVNIPGGNNVLEQVDQVKYLGVHLDEHLTFQQHVDKLCSKVRSRSGVLWRMRSFISEELAKELYQTMVHPHFSYADIIYDASNQSLSNKLQTQQHLALKADLYIDQMFSSSELHSQTKINWLDSERKERCCIEKFKALHNLSSNNVNSLYNKTMYGGNLCSDDTMCFKPAPMRTKFGEGNLPDRSAVHWDTLPVEVRNIDN